MARLAERLQQNPRRQEVARTIVLWLVFVGLLAGGLGVASALSPDADDWLQAEPVTVGRVTLRLPEGFRQARLLADPGARSLFLVAEDAEAADDSPRLLVVSLLLDDRDRNLDALAQRASGGRAGDFHPLDGLAIEPVDAPRSTPVNGRPARTVAIAYGIDGRYAGFSAITLTRLDDDSVLRVEVLRLGEFDGRAASLARAVASSVRVESLRVE